METVHLYVFMMLCFVIDRSSSDILYRQKRAWIIESFTISESYNGRFPYLLGTIHVEKNLTFFEIEGQGADEEPKGILQIDKHTGELTVHGPVDYEKFKVLKLKFKALDKFSKTIDTRLGIEVSIIDSNDNAPKFEHEMYEISIKESTVQGTDVITLKATDDDRSEKNHKCDLHIVSVTPESQDLEFYLTITSLSASPVGTISFKGCLDHEKAKKYTIIVEAKDRGEPTPLSSSCTVIINIEDGNNHLPVITQQTGPGRVKEGLENVIVSRLKVTDQDIKGTAAWRAKYQIHGDTNNNFRITTDPETNEGLLYVQKQLDYEDSPLKNITISVENEISYYSCEVKSRTSSGLWKVAVHSATTTSTIAGVTATERAWSLSTYHVTVIVENVNEPPIFNEPKKDIKLFENTEAGQYLVTFKARDPDVTSANTFVYKKGQDPADWVTVDPNTGKITTSKTVDRESHFVKNSTYVVTVYAVDNGEPQMTGTATLSIHIGDQNDNAPSLVVSTIDICQSQEPSGANITAVDLDQEPYGGPFNFKLHGDVEGKWKVDPVQGYSVSLVKETTVHSGHYKLLLEVSDLQGETSVHNLTVTVCDCLNTTKPNCRVRKPTASTPGGTLLGLIFIAVLLFAGTLLLVFLVSCKKVSLTIPDGSEQHLMSSNTEKQGTDCQVAFRTLHQGYGHKGQHFKTTSQATLRPPSIARVSIAHDRSGYGISQREVLQERNHLHWSMGASSTKEIRHEHRNATHEFMGASSTKQIRHEHRNATHEFMGALSTKEIRHEHRNAIHENGMGHRYSDHVMNGIKYEAVLYLLTKRLHTLQGAGKELGDYGPHVYAEEGGTEENSELDAISIADTSLNPDFGQDLDFKFNTLASICISSESPPVTTTLVQVETHKTKMKTDAHL